MEGGRTATVRRRRPVRTLLCLPFFLVKFADHTPSKQFLEGKRKTETNTLVQEFSTLGRSFPLTNSAIKNSSKGTSCHTNLSYANVAPLSCIKYSPFLPTQEVCRTKLHGIKLIFYRTRTFPKSFVHCTPLSFPVIVGLPIIFIHVTKCSTALLTEVR